MLPLHLPMQPEQLKFQACASCYKLQVFTLRLHNPREVPAEWSIKRPAVDSPKLRDWGFFVPQPAESVLELGISHYQCLHASALQRGARQLQLPIKVANNSNT